MNIDYVMLENYPNSPIRAYLLGTTVHQNQTYIYYVTDLKEKYTSDDIYIGQMINNQIVPIDDKLFKYLESKFHEIFTHL